MPYKPSYGCNVQGCPNLSVKSGRCASHYVPPVDNRPPAYVRGYDTHWYATRRKHIKDNPICVGCGRQAVMVDHITPICAGGSDEDDNLQSMCRYCHAQKTSRQNPVRREKERQSGYEHG